MASVYSRKETGRLLIEFQYCGVRCREQTALHDTSANRRKLGKIVEQIEAEILLGTFRYRDYFPDSPRAVRFDHVSRSSGPESDDPLSAQQMPRLDSFAWLWFQENSVRWKQSQIDTVRINLRTHIIPLLGHLRIDEVDRSRVLRFRSTLPDHRRGSDSGRRLSNDRINHVMTTLKGVFDEASRRWHLTNPCNDIGRLPVQLPDVHPLTLEEVKLFLANVRPDFHDYFLVRFFTGLRTGEVDGLRWRHVDFERRDILVREARVNGRLETTKNRYSMRDVRMSRAVHSALERQWARTAAISEYVFCNENGAPLNYRNVNKRVWTPTLRYLEIPYRRAYQTRHTAATLWLAAGENPEWIARQLGHSSTEMLFQRYSRYIPNLTRRDGSAFDTLLDTHGWSQEEENNDDAAQ